MSRIHAGATLITSSAAAAASGESAIPVYEIYKAGLPAHWLTGLNLVGTLLGVRVAIVPHWNNAEGATHDTSRCFIGDVKLRELERGLASGVAILGIDNLRVRVSGDQQAIFQTRGFHEALHRIDAVDIAGAAQGDIEGGHVGRQAQFVLDDGCGVGQPFFIATSFSKSFSLYGERVGALSIVTGSQEEAGRVLSQAKRVIRTNYSNPPTHGATVVASVLNSPELRALWEEELAGMRERIRGMRMAMVEQLAALNCKRDFSFVAQQRGMFSYSGLTAEQVERLKTEFGIYAVSTGRICVAALNQRNLPAVTQAIAQVL